MKEAPRVPDVPTLSPRRKQILDYIQRYVKRNGYGPTLQEIGDFIGLKSVASVHRQVSTLKTLGLIQWEPSARRSMRMGDASGVCPACNRPLPGKGAAASVVNQ